MLNQNVLSDLPGSLQIAGLLCQMSTAIMAAAIGMITFRYTKRQNALTLINQNNTLANQVNTTILQCEDARDTLSRLHKFVVGCPDDAILFMYLNYVHNTFRMHKVGVVSVQVWQDTLSSCANMMGRLRRHQLEELLSRGYEAEFKNEVLARYDATADEPEVDTLATVRMRNTRRNRMALVG